MQENGDLDYTTLANIVSDIAAAESDDRHFVIITSGAIAAGRRRERMRAMAKRQRDQLFAAVGQPKLMSFYEHLFSRHSKAVGQLLLSRHTFASRVQYFGIRDALRGMLTNAIVPIINNNDVLQLGDDDFSDNDQLAACVAGMINASQVVFLTTAPGVLKDMADLNSVVDTVNKAEDFAVVQARVTNERRGRGGMSSKVKACRLLFDLGIQSAIAAGHTAQAISSVLAGTTKCTRFVPSAQRQLTGVRKWLCTGAVPRGYVHVSEAGGEVITGQEKRGSLLASGITQVRGEFARGEVVCVCSEDATLLGYGISRLSAAEIEQCRGTERTIVIHADYFYGTTAGLF